METENKEQVQDNEIKDLENKLKEIIANSFQKVNENIKENIIEVVSNNLKDTTKRLNILESYILSTTVVIEYLLDILQQNKLVPENEELKRIIKEKTEATLNSIKSNMEKELKDEQSEQDNSKDTN